MAIPSTTSSEYIEFRIRIVTSSTSFLPMSTEASSTIIETSSNSGIGTGHSSNEVSGLKYLAIAGGAVLLSSIALIIAAMMMYGRKRSKKSGDIESSREMINTKKSGKINVSNNDETYDTLFYETRGVDLYTGQTIPSKVPKAPPKLSVRLSRSGLNFEREFEQFNINELQRQTSKSSLKNQAAGHA
jgi:hypothetical protein